MTSQELATRERPSLLQKFGDRYSVDPKKVYTTLQQTAFKKAASEEQFIALLIVADQYGLNPFTREIYAFPQDGGVVPVVGVDGWLRIINDHDQFDGVDFNESENRVVPDGGKSCPEWIEAVIYRKDRGHPTTAREYLEECYRKTGPWQSHTKRMLRHKALIQCARMAFGFTGIYDPDEAERVINGEYTEIADDLSYTPVAARARAALGVEVDQETGEVTQSAAQRPQDGPQQADEAEGDTVDADAFEDDEEPQEAKLTADQAKTIKAHKVRLKSNNPDWIDFLTAGYGVASALDLTYSQAEHAIAELDKMTPESWAAQKAML